MTYQVASTPCHRAHQFSLSQPAENTFCFAMTISLPSILQMDPRIGPQKFESLFRASPVQYCSSHPIGSASLQNGLQYISDNFSPAEKSEFFRQCLERQKENIASLLIDCQIVDVSMKDNWNRTALFHSVAYGADWLVEKILQKVGDAQSMFVNERDRLGNSPLLIAMEKGRERCVDLLAGAGAEWEMGNCQGLTPLHVAFSKALPHVKVWFQKGLIPISFGFLNYYYQLDPAARKAFECVDAIFDVTRMYPPCCKFFYFTMLLHSHDYELARTMIEKEVISATEQDAAGCTLLHHAVLWGYAPLIHFLIEFYKQKDVNLDACDMYKYTALHWACYRGDFSCAQSLVSGGADCNKKDCNNHTPISLLLSSNFSLGKKCLLKMQQKGDLDVTSIIGSTYFSLDVYQRHEINKILPMRELLHIKLLAHIWGIKGIMQCSGIRMSYEGHQWNVLLKVFLDAMSKFLVEFPQHECYQHLRKKVQKLPPTLDLPPQEIVQDIAQGERVIFPLVPVRHVAYLLLTKDHLYVCDCGGLGCGAGVISYKIRRPENLTKWLEALVSLQYNFALRSYLKAGLPQDLEWEKIDHLPQEQADVGNCAAGSAKSFLFALLFDEALEQGIPREKAKQLAYKTYKRFTAWVRIHSLECYLQESGYKDTQLLGAIKQKLCDPTRLQLHFPNIERRADAVRDIQKAINSAAEDEE